jgi:hypothetical protein
MSAARQHLVCALLAGLLTVPTTYAALRGYDVMFRSEANPATVIWSAKIAMFWRLGIGSYLGGMVAFGVYFLARRDLARVVRGLVLASVVVAALASFQGLFLP